MGDILVSQAERKLWSSVGTLEEFDGELAR